MKLTENKNHRDERNLEGRRCVFTLKHRSEKDVSRELEGISGQEVIVQMRMDETLYDYEKVGTAWEIETLEGSQYDVFADELTLVEIVPDSEYSIDKKFEVENPNYGIGIRGDV